MSGRRRFALSVVALVAVAAVAVALFVRRAAAPDGAATTTATTTSAQSANAIASPQDGSDLDSPPPTSEVLIAAALKAGDITYEESLMARAYAIFDDPRLPRQFRSPIIDWEAGTALLIEVDDKESTLSQGLLADLAPFRVRPNDPTSIVNRPRAEVVKAQGSPRATWVSRLVPGTTVRIWIKGTQADLDFYAPMLKRVWGVFPGFFTYPGPDDGSPASPINPDGAIDFYLLDLQTADPRSALCASAPATSECHVGGGTGGMARPAGPRGDDTSSAYVLINLVQTDDNMLDAMAHEYTHVSQLGYDETEEWLKESTATWVAYKVMKRLGLTPSWEYDRLDPAGMSRGWERWAFFNSLDRPLPALGHQYGSWLFFYYASMELGDGIVKAVWQKAAIPGLQGESAVNKAIPFDDHFPRFAVRNWNQDPVLNQYKTQDATFRPGLKPGLGPSSSRSPLRKIDVPGPGTTELAEPVEPLAARYYDFSFDGSIHKVTFQNLFTDLPNAHVWAIKKIGTDWKEPEDWTKDMQKIFCRDSSLENVTELVVIVSNTHTEDPLPTSHPKPRIVSDSAGCPYIDGWAKATILEKDGQKEVKYVSSRVPLRFKPTANVDRVKEDQQSGNSQYDLMPTSVTWTAAGRDGNCTIVGQYIVNIPPLMDLPVDPTRPAYGYMNIVGLNNGDFHSLTIAAMDPAARLTMTCPGDPPRVTKTGTVAGYLLMILSHANTRDGSNIIYKGFQGPAYNRSFGKLEYTFEWELRPTAIPPP